MTTQNINNMPVPNALPSSEIVSFVKKLNKVCNATNSNEDAAPCSATQNTQHTKTGVIAAIIDFVRDSKGNQFVLGDIHAVLVKKFPDRDSNGLMRTIRTQVPNRLSKERGFEFVREQGMLRCISCK